MKLLSCSPSELVLVTGTGSWWGQHWRNRHWAPLERWLDDPVGEIQLHLQLKANCRTALTVSDWRSFLFLVHLTSTKDLALNSVALNRLPKPVLPDLIRPTTLAISRLRWSDSIRILSESLLDADEFHHPTSSFHSHLLVRWLSVRLAALMRYDIYFFNLIFSSCNPPSPSQSYLPNISNIQPEHYSMEKTHVPFCSRLPSFSV